MAIIILLVCFINLFFCFGAEGNPATSTKEIILKTVLAFSGFVVLTTELLSLFTALNFRNILFCWLLISGLSVLYLYLKKARFKFFYHHLKHRVKEASLKIQASRNYEKWLLFSVLIILVLIFIQGIVYPTNNWDSMNYHSGRIPSWVSHQSVAHYPTGAIRQIYQPPFAEYVVMQINILTGNDYFSSSVQFFFLIFSIVGLVAIVGHFGLGFPYKIITVFLGLTIPEIVLQATTTQNDIVVGFFVIAAFYFAVKSTKSFSARNALFFGLAVGIGILTKGTAYVYMPAILLIYGFTMLIKLIADQNYNYLLYAFLAGSVFLAVNAGFYVRNYQLTANILGVDDKEYGTYSNDKMDAKRLLSSIVKNAGNHIGLLHLKPLSVVSAKAILKFHTLIGVDINDPANNYYKDKYDTLYNPDHEDAAPNLIELVLVIAALIVIIVKSFSQKIPLNVKLLTFAIIFQGLFFCFYLKYQPFHTRLQTSMFLLSVPLVPFALSVINFNFKKLFYWLTPFVFAYALIIVLGNLNHPFNKTITKSRYEKYFIAKPWIYEEYAAINQKIQASSYKNIGLIMGDGEFDFEYVLFTNCFSKPINPVYIQVNNYTKNSKISAGPVDCIVSTTGNPAYIDYLNKRFYNQNPQNKFIHLFR